MIVSGRGLHLIAATEHVLPNQLHRHVRITRLGEVAESGAANESAFALWIEPPYRLRIGNDRSNWCTRLVALSALLSTTLTTPAATAAAAALSASALIATA